MTLLRHNQPLEMDRRRQVLLAGSAAQWRRSAPLMSVDAALNIAEILYDSCAVRFCYVRVLSDAPGL